MVIAKEEETSTRSQRFLRFSDTRNILLQVQSLNDLLCSQMIILSQRLKYSMRIWCYFYIQEEADLILRHTLLFQIAADMDCFVGEAIIRVVLDCIHTDHVEFPLFFAELFQLIYRCLVWIHSIVFHLLSFVKHAHKGRFHILLIAFYHDCISIYGLVQWGSIGFLNELTLSQIAAFRCIGRTGLANNLNDVMHYLLTLELIHGPWKWQVPNLFIYLFLFLNLQIALFRYADSFLPLATKRNHLDDLNTKKHTFCRRNES